MKQLTTIAILLLLTACARKTQVTKSTRAIEKDSSYHFVDTTKKVTTTKVTEVTNYGGDSLQSSIYLPFADSLFLGMTDSISSNGIKVRITYFPYLDGYKLNVLATAKPKSTEKTTETNAAEQKGIAATGEVKTKEKETVKAKATESEGFPWGWLIAAIALTLIAVFLIKKYVK